MIKVGICEDEKVCRESIGKLLEEYFKQKGIQYQQKEYESGQSFMEEKEKTDILLLDVEMEGISGIQLKNWLWREDADTKIVFVTKHMEEMPEAFGKNVYGFLQKPLKEARLEKYLNRMIEDIDEDHNLVVRSINQDIAKNIKDIFYFVSDTKYSRMVCDDDDYFCDKSLLQLEEELKDQFFFRCHKCYLVNLRNIRHIEDSICMKNGDRVPISRRKGKALKESYRQYIIRKAR